MTLLTDEQKRTRRRVMQNATARKLRELNPDKYRAYQRKWQAENKDKVAAYKKKYLAKIAPTPRKPRTQKQREYQRQWQARNRHKTSAYHRKWLEKGGRESVRNYEKRKRESDPDFRIAATLRNRIRCALRGIHKGERTESLLGCSISNFRVYLESKFEVGMTWENYGSFWEIDHIIPCAIFDLSKPEHQKRCFHFSNHQPLTVSANRRKHTKTESIIWDY